MNKHIFLILFIVGMLSRQVQAQDFIFSQSSFVPLELNPAYTGMFDESIRLNTLYRNQWKKIDLPYRTLQASLDSRINWHASALGLGIHVIGDENAVTGFAQSRAYFNLAYHKFIEGYQFSFGIQPGMGYNTINFNSLTFPSQYDAGSGLFNPSLSNNENGYEGNRMFFDMGAGIAVRTKFPSLQPRVAFALKHINTPSLSFFENDSSANLPLRHNWMGDVLIKTPFIIDIQPVVRFTRMQKTSELMLGNYFILENLPGEKALPMYLIGGVFFRTNLLHNFDALLLNMQVQLRTLSIGINYDINLSALHQASAYYGAFELGIGYRFNLSPQQINYIPCTLF